jgi:Lrp/AsnC family transcriptional regulator, leucine-responsive regulatory protein
LPQTLRGAVIRETKLDDKGWQILQALQDDARISYSNLAKRVGLSVPSVVERVRKLEDVGIITGYRAQINLCALGLPLTAVVRFHGTGRQMTEVAEAVETISEVVRAHRMTGDTCFLAVVAVRSTAHLETLMDRLSRYGETRTSVIVSTPVEERRVDRTMLEQSS